MSWQQILIAVAAVIAGLAIYDRFLRKRVRRFPRLSKILKASPGGNWTVVQTFTDGPHPSRRVPRWVVKEWRKGKKEATGRHFEYRIISGDGPEQGQHWGQVERKRRHK